jgi:hypothetical protein
LNEIVAQNKGICIDLSNTVFKSYKITIKIRFTMNISQNGSNYGAEVQIIPVLIHAAQIVLNSLGSFTNFIIVLMYCKYPTLRALNAIHLITVLACGDFLLCFGSIANCVKSLFTDFSYMTPIVTKMACILFNTPSYVGRQWSQIGACLIAFDRLAAIRSPLTYRSKNHAQMGRRAAFLIAVYSIGAIAVATILQKNLYVCVVMRNEMKFGNVNCRWKVSAQTMQ